MIGIERKIEPGNTLLYSVMSRSNQFIYDSEQPDVMCHPYQIMSFTGDEEIETSATASASLKLLART